MDGLEGLRDMENIESRKEGVLCGTIHVTGDADPQLPDLRISSCGDSSSSSRDTSQQNSGKDLMISVSHNVTGTSKCGIG